MLWTAGRSSWSTYCWPVCDTWKEFFLGFYVTYLCYTLMTPAHYLFKSFKSTSGFLMIFFLVMPGLFGGFGNYFVPIFQGSPEVVYPRVNNFSILILILSYLFVILSLISEFGGGTGWTLYPPLSTSFMSLSPSSTAFKSLWRCIVCLISFLLPAFNDHERLSPKKRCCRTYRLTFPFPFVLMLLNLQVMGLLLVIFFIIFGFSIC